ncbi:shikimate kinase [Devosia enhydra]|uniref:Shikimate kinase n=1 Tax=Devosia enhydra TaxID=665118 RepID=A0A1K2I071_9HYPH|nr:shikimate kinase [Devosia enhydra]
MTRASKARDADTETIEALLAGRPIVLVGMMGAGKTTVGRRLAQRLGRRFIDSDEEIESAAGMSIEDLFKAHGEPEFRAGEARVVSRLLREPGVVLGTGGGAFMNAETRAEIARQAVSIWLKADLDVLFARVSRRSNRPLLKTANPRETLKGLMDTRYPVYAEADVTVLSREVSQDQVAADVVAALVAHLGAMAAPEREKETAHGG